jgi:F-type H+-transporting ATPase subunit a
MKMMNSLSPSLNMFAASDGPKVSIGPEALFHIGPLTITNANVLALIGATVILTLAFKLVKGVRNNSRSRFVHGAMALFENLYDTTIEVVGDRTVARKILPLAVTLFFFFLVNNWLGLLPFLNAVTYHGEPLLRGAAADMNTTFALAIISIVTAQVWAIKRRGFFGNIKRYIVNPFKDPLHAFEGFLEIIAEFSRTLALSLRMFGNVFGGEVLLGVIAFLSGWAAGLALPLFYVLELFVGAVQAYVFFMLTIAFVGLGLPADDEHGNESEHSEPAGSPKPTHTGVAEGRP